MEKVKTEAKTSQKIMLVVGEASGDLHGAELISAIQKVAPETYFFGMGGSRMREVGFDSRVDSESSASVMGISETFSSFFKIIKAFNLLIEITEVEKPDLVIFIDFADFNMRLAKKLHKRGFKTLYYIVPKVWAWRKWRVANLRKYFDKLVAIFPFEKDFYQKNGANVEYVGSPFLDFKQPEQSREEFFADLSLDPHKKTIALMPGSRKSEITALLPVFLESFKILKNDIPELQAIIPLAPGLDEEWFRSVATIPSGVVVCGGQSHQVLKTVDAVALASGTATLEAAMFSVPTVVAYKLSSLSFFVVKNFIKGVSYASLTNIIAGKEVVKELLQERANPEELAFEMKNLLCNETYRENMKAEFEEIKESLRVGDGKAVEKAAKIVVEML